MLVLIDESGCPGFKLTKGSTPYFIVGMIIFEDFTQAEFVSKSIAALGQTLQGAASFNSFSKIDNSNKTALSNLSDINDVYFLLELLFLL